MVVYTNPVQLIKNGNIYPAIINPVDFHLKVFCLFISFGQLISKFSGGHVCLGTTVVNLQNKYCDVDEVDRNCVILELFFAVTTNLDLSHHIAGTSRIGKSKIYAMQKSESKKTIITRVRNLPKDFHMAVTYSL